MKGNGNAEAADKARTKNVFVGSSIFALKSYVRSSRLSLGPRSNENLSEKLLCETYLIYAKEASGLDVVLNKGQNKVDSGAEIRDGGYPLLPRLNQFRNSVCIVSDLNFTVSGLLNSRCIVFYNF